MFPFQYIIRFHNEITTTFSNKADGSVFLHNESRLWQGKTLDIHRKLLIHFQFNTRQFRNVGKLMEHKPVPKARELEYFITFRWFYLRSSQSISIEASIFQFRRSIEISTWEWKEKGIRLGLNITKLYLVHREVFLYEPELASFITTMPTSLWECLLGYLSCSEIFSLCCLLFWPYIHHFFHNLCYWRRFYDKPTKVHHVRTT